MSQADAERLRQAAQRLGISQSAFIRLSLEAAYRRLDDGEWEDGAKLSA